MRFQRAVPVVAILLSGVILRAPGSTLSGHVVDAKASQPVAGASVAVDVLLPDSVSFFAVSDSAGAYVVSGLPPDNAIYVIRCHVPGFAPLYMRYDALAAGDRQVDLLMQPAEISPPGGAGDSATVSGKILFELAGGGRNPVNQAIVTLTSGVGQSAAHTGTDGTYSLRVPRASYGLTVAASGFHTLTGTGVTVDSAGLTLNVLLKSTAVAVSPEVRPIPASYSLGNAYPNPFNPSTTIGFALPLESRVTLKVYNLLGGEVARIVEGVVPAGRHTVRFNPSGLPSGVYVYRLTARSLAAGDAGQFTQTKRMILVR